MSGGHWDYAGGRIAYDLEAMAEDPEVQQRWPMLARTLMQTAQWFRAVEHEMDWDLSSDSKIEDDGAFDLAAVGALLDLVLKVMPDAHFDRGKWGTIHAWQQRTGAESSSGFRPAGGEP